MLLLSGCNWLPGAVRPSPTESPDTAQPTATTARESRDDSIELATTETSAAPVLQTTDLWRRIGAELRMSAPAKHRSKNPLAKFGSARFITRAAENATPFLAHIYREIERRGLPFEIILIPVIESAYNPHATSPSGAAGIWQFMPATGQRFGLQQTRWYDGRRDLVASTEAALQYFELLRDRFMGDWQLVFAAYNCGERTVERAIAKNARAGLATDFYALELPLATKNYVPKLFALVEIIADPQAWAIDLPMLEDQRLFTAVDVGPELDLNRVIEWAGISPEQFDHLNAGFRKRLTVKGAPTAVLVPHASVAALNTGLAAMPASQRGQAREHVVKSGETLSHIAAATAIPIATLKRVNRLSSNRLSIGQRLVIPGPEAVYDDARNSLNAAPAVSQPTTVHTVVAGDNLWDIARHYNTTVAKLSSINGINRGKTLRLGEQLKIPSRASTTTNTTVAETRRYRVRNGDSLWTISRRFKVSVAELTRWNSLNAKTLLQPGQQLIIARP